jgi:cytochrome c oxidase cbb3-type subunit I/II
MIRPFRYEVKRYGEYSKAGETVYDHPFQFGSKRTGPDLAREGGLKGNNWHYNHMYDPQTLVTGSIMPAYPSLFENLIDKGTTASKIHTMRNLGVPYPDNYETQANADLEKQANEIVENFKQNDINASADKEIIAMIAYLQRLGTDIKNETK